MAADYRQLLEFFATSQSPNYHSSADTNITPANETMAQLLASGAIRSTAGMYNTEEGGGGDTGYLVDFDKVPLAKLPNGQTVLPAALTATDERGSNLIDPSLRWNDPNYGLVSTSRNNSAYKHDFWDTLYNIVPSLFIAGTGSMIASAGLGSSFGMRLPRIAQTLSRLATGRSAVSGTAPTASQLPILLAILSRLHRGGGG